MTQDLYYIEEGYYDIGYYVYTADAESAVTSNFSQTCDAEVLLSGGIIEASANFNTANSVIANAGKIAAGNITMASSFSQTVTISHIHGSDLFAFSQAAIAIQIDRIRSTNISVSGAYTVTANAERTRYISGSLDSIVDFTAIVSRSISIQAAHSAAFSLTVTGSQAQLASAAINSQFIEVTNASRASRNVQATVYNSGAYVNNLSIDNTVSKFGSGSLKVSPPTGTISEPQYYAAGGTNIIAWNATHLWYSNNSGSTWTKIAHPSPGNFQKMFYLNGRFITISGARSIMYSTNGSTWTTKVITTDTLYNLVSGQIGFVGTRWFIGSQSIGTNSFFIVWSSTDLVTWNTTQLSTATGANGGVGIQSISSNGSTAKMSVVGFNIGNANGIWSSTTGNTWTLENATPNYVGNLDNNGSNQWMGVQLTSGGANTTSIWTNSGTSTWTNKTLPAAAYRVQYVNGVWYSYTENSSWDSAGTTYQSTDLGTTWTLVAPRKALTKFDGKYYGVNSTSNGFYGFNELNYSTDLVTWTNVQLSNTLSPTKIKYTTSLQNWRTIDFWINVPTQTYTEFSNIEILHQYTGIPTEDLGFSLGAYINLGANTHQIRFTAAGTVGDVGLMRAPFPNNAWAHIRISYDDAAAKISIYVNGTLATYISQPVVRSNIPKVSVAPVFLESNPLYNFYIDDLLITEELLTPSAVTSFTVPTSSNSTNPPSVDLFLPFDNDLFDSASTLYRDGRGTLQSTFTTNATVEKLTTPTTAFITSVTSLSVSAGITIRPASTVNVISNANDSTYGGLVIDTAVKKFGAGSLKFQAKDDGYYPSSSITPVYGSAGWIAVTTGGTVFKSTDDSANWVIQSQVLITNFGTSVLKYLNGQYIFVDSDRLHYSSNGTSWTTVARTQNGVSNHVGKMAYNNSRYYMIRNSGNFGNILNTTTLASGNWNQGFTYNPYGGALTYISDIHTAGTATVAVGELADGSGSGKVAPVIHYTTSGTTWNTVVIGASSGSAMINRKFLSVTHDGTAWYALATEAINQNTFFLYKSTNLNSWTPTTLTFNDVRQVTYINNNLLLLTSSGSKKSTDGGTTWTDYGTNLGFNSFDTEIEFNASTWIYSNYLSTDNGVNWTSNAGSFYRNRSPSLTYTTGLNLTQTKTIDFWFNTEAAPASGFTSDVFALITIQGLIGINLSRNAAGQHTISTSSGTQISTAVLTANTWNHIRISKVGSTVALYLNGSRAGIQTNYPQPTLPRYTGIVGGSGVGKRNAYWIDEIFISDDLLTPTATTSFAVPTAPYTNTPTTTALLPYNINFEDNNIGTYRLGIASLLSIGTINCNANKLQGPVTANLSSTSSLSASAEKVITAISNLQSNGFVTVITGRIRPGIEFVDTVSTLSVIATVNKPLSANLTSQLSVACEVTKSIGTITINTQSTSSVVVSANKTSDVIIDEHIVSTLNSSPVAVARTAVPLLSTSILDILTAVNKTYIADIRALVDLTSTITKQFGAFTANLNAVTTQVTVTRKTAEASANLQVQAFELNDVNVDFRASANLVVTSTVVAYTETGKIGECFVTSTSSVSCLITKELGPISSFVASSSNLVLVPQVTRTTPANLESAGFVTVINGRIRPAFEFVDTVSTLEVNPVVNFVGSGNLNAVSTVETVVTKQIGPITAVLATESSLTIIGIILPSGSIACQVSTQLDVTADRIRDVNANLEVNAAELSLSTVSRGLVASLTATSSTQATALRIQQLSADFNAVVTDISVINKIGNTLIDCGVVSALTCSLSTIKRDISLEVAAATLTASANVIKGVTSNITARATVNANAGKQVIGSANLQALAFELVIARILKLETADEWLVPAETRYWRVPRDINLDDAVIYVVPSETRRWTIPTETNYYTIELEDRTFKIKGN